MTRKPSQKQSLSQNDQKFESQKKYKSKWSGNKVKNKVSQNDNKSESSKNKVSQNDQKTK